MKKNRILLAALAFAIAFVYGCEEPKNNIDVSKRKGTDAATRKDKSGDQ